MASAIDLLEEAPEPPAPTTGSEPPQRCGPGALTHLYQALSSYPVVRPTGLLLTERLAETALAHNRTLPTEPARAVRLKIRADGEGIRFVKRRCGDGWELCFHPLEVGFSDIVEQLPEGEAGPRHWRVAVNNTDVVLAWTGSWEERPEVPGLWLGTPWLRSSISGDEIA